MPIKQCTLGEPGSQVQVGEIGLGLMGFTFPNFAPRETPLSDEEAFEAMKAAIDAGATFWNGSSYYGFGKQGELLNLELVARFFTKYPELADKVVLSVKGGFNMATYSSDGSPEFLREDIDKALKALNGKKKLDLFEMGRVDKNRQFHMFQFTDNRPIEEVIQTLAGFIEEGKFNYIGLSEVSAQTIRRAAKIHHIATVEIEFSLWSTEIKTNGVLDACNELGIKIVAYSPLGRGILSGRWEKPEDVPEALKAAFPRYSDENFEENKKFLEMIKKVAAKKHATPAQVALKWILTQGNGNIIPIPGATRAERVKENTNAANLELTEEELTIINEFVDTTEVKGGRYAKAHEAALWG